MPGRMLAVHLPELCSGSQVPMDAPSFSALVAQLPALVAREVRAWDVRFGAPAPLA